MDTVIDKHYTDGLLNNRIIKKFLIFEGPDNTGKGTQIKLVHENCTERLFHTVHYSGLGFPLPEQHIEYSKELYEDMFKMMFDSKVDRNFIFDRSHLGEMVYAPLYRKYDGDYVLDIEKKYTEDLANNLYLIVFINDPETILKRDDGLSYYQNLDGVRQEVNYFIEAYNKSQIHNKILINVGNKTPQEIHEIVMDFIKE